MSSWVLPRHHKSNQTHPFLSLHQLDPLFTLPAAPLPIQAKRLEAQAKVQALLKSNTKVEVSKPERAFKDAPKDLSLGVLKQKMDEARSDLEWDVK